LGKGTAFRRPAWQPNTGFSEPEIDCGAFLLALGLVILSANLDAIAACISSFAGISAPEGPEIFPALGLAALHAAQTYTFDHARFLSSLLRILVSFWPVISSSPEFCCYAMGYSA